MANSQLVSGKRVWMFYVEVVLECFMVEGVLECFEEVARNISWDTEEHLPTGLICGLFKVA